MHDGSVLGVNDQQFFEINCSKRGTGWLTELAFKAVERRWTMIEFLFSDILFYSAASLFASTAICTAVFVARHY